MKTIAKISVTGAFVLLNTFMYSQTDSLGMPGDNLNLRAVLSIFKQSSNVEDFEKRLNSADSKVNNLDLNGDNQVDYLRIVDYGKDDFHSIVIQDAVSKTESQDVAVIEIVKKDDNTAHLQIVGDETLYGKDYIIEPADQAPLNSSNRNNIDVNDDVYANGNSNTGSNASQSNVSVNVWGWPAVSYMYAPGYSYWVSPWYWGYYPGWYSPWRPWGWYSYNNFYYGYNYGFYGYRRNYYAYPRAHNYYYGHRMSSGYVQKTAPRYSHRNSGYYHDGGQRVQQRSTSSGYRGSDRNTANSRAGNRTANGSANNRNSDYVRSQRSTSGAMRNNNNQRQNVGSSSQRVNSGSSSSGRIDRSSNGRTSSPGGSGRINSGGNGGGRMSSPGGGGRIGGGGGHMGGGGGGGRTGGGGGHSGGGGRR